MELLAKIEIIGNSLELEKFLEGLNNGVVTSFTVIRNVMSRGVRGAAANDLEMSVYSNIYVVAFCLKEQLNKVAEIITPILKRFGGVCYVSDVQLMFGGVCYVSDLQGMGG